MKKNIVILDDEIANDYSFSVIEGIQDFFKDKDVRLIFAQTRIPHTDVGIYEYQYWAATNYFNISEIDAIIIGSDAVCQHHTLLERIVFPCHKIKSPQAFTCGLL